MIKRTYPALFNISMTVLLFSLLMFVSSDHHQGFLSLKKMLPPTATRDTVPNFGKLLKGGHRIGPADAPVQIVEFADFQCPYCKQMIPIINAMRLKYPNRVSFIYYNFPLDHHPQAKIAAIAAECAARQGKYFSYHDLLFNSQSAFHTMPWDSLANLAGIENMDEFKGCVSTKATEKLVEDEVKLGDKIKVEVTPTFIINGVMYKGTLTEKQMDGIIKSNLFKPAK